MICGGGVAAVESLLALREHLGIAVELHLIAPNDRFVYQPLAVAAPFGDVDTHPFSLAELAAEQHVELHRDTLACVEVAANRAVLASSIELPYDALLVAVGAERREWLENALHFAGARSVTAFEALLERLENGPDRLLSFVSPGGNTWTLPLYELALLTASHLADRGVIGTEVTFITAEKAPLAAFGPTAASIVRDLLADRGITLKTALSVQKIEHGKLHLDARSPIEVENVVTVPHLAGPGTPGLTCDDDGFIVIDEHARVAGMTNVYAAGDGTNEAIKQGGVAAQQADAAAETIAAQLGAAIRPIPYRPTLRGMLLDGIAPTYLRANATATDDDRFETSVTPLWKPNTKIAGRHLAPYIARRHALTTDRTLVDRPPGRGDTATLQESHEEARKLAMVFADRDATDGDFKSALQWLEVLETLDGVLDAPFSRKRREWREHSAR